MLERHGKRGFIYFKQGTMIIKTIICKILVKESKNLSVGKVGLLNNSIVDVFLIKNCMKFWTSEQQNQADCYLKDNYGR